MAKKPQKPGSARNGAEKPKPPPGEPTPPAPEPGPPAKKRPRPDASKRKPRMGRESAAAPTRRVEGLAFFVARSGKERANRLGGAGSDRLRPVGRSEVQRLLSKSRVAIVELTGGPPGARPIFSSSSSRTFVTSSPETFTDLVTNLAGSDDLEVVVADVSNAPDGGRAIAERAIRAVPHDSRKIVVVAGRKAHLRGRRSVPHAAGRRIEVLSEGAERSRDRKGAGFPIRHETD